MVASPIKDLAGGIVEVPELGVGLLRVLAGYVGNASGKTNVLRALAYMSHAVEASQRQWEPSAPIPREPFLLDRHSQDAPSCFDVDIVVNGTRYNYGFELGRERVIREWLNAFPHGKKQTWFSRSEEEPTGFRFGKNLLGENRSIQNLTRPNSLFLSAAAQNGHQQLLPIYDWFAKRVESVNPASRGSLRMSAVRMCENPSGRKALLQFLSAADIGIVDLEVKEEEVDEKMAKALRAFLSTLNNDDSSVIDLPKMPNIRLRHQANGEAASVALGFEDESDGTKTLFSLAGPVFNAIATGGLLAVDELDASLHPILALNIVRVFSSSTSNPLNAQLLFNTHDTNLLDGDVLRRDQIWFAEKDSSGATHVYPLSDFRPRRNENLERGYLQGRYGAVPIPSSLIGSTRGE